MNQILCLADQPWSSSPGRTQQLLSRLRGVDILYICPGEKGEKKVRANVTVCGVPQPRLPMAAQAPHLLRLALLRRARYVAERAARHRFHSPLLWTTDPKQIHLLDHLDYSGLVYDCARVWDDLPLQWESSLARAADLVFAASPGLAHRLSPCSDNIAILPNGVNFPLFAGDAAALRSDPFPQVTGPLIGFAGTLGGELDLSPILYAARQRPDWTFLLLGEDRGAPLLPKVRRLPNVLVPGPCPLTNVPDYIGRCDVLVELLHGDQAYSDVVPIRMYEYLATGRPVVSMLWPDQVEPFPDVVYSAYDQEEFLTLCRHALTEAPGFVSHRRRARGEAANWSNRVDQLGRILRTSGLL